MEELDTRNCIGVCGETKSTKHFTMNGKGYRKTCNDCIMKQCNGICGEVKTLHNNFVRKKNQFSPICNDCAQNKLKRCEGACGKIRNIEFFSKWGAGYMTKCNDCFTKKCIGPCGKEKPRSSSFTKVKHQYKNVCIECCGIKKLPKPITPTKTCSACTKFLPLSEFKTVKNRSGNGRTYSTQCNNCHKLTLDKRELAIIESGGKCKECGEYNPREVGKPRCYKCKNKKSYKTVSKKRKTSKTSRCSTCKNIHKNSNMIAGANQCKGCNKKSRNVTKEKNKELLKTMDLSELRECTKCCDVKELREFVLRSDSYIYRYRCTVCDKELTKNKFIRFRLAKILEDPEKFRSMAAEQMCKWRYDNPEKWKEMNKKYKNCISSKLKYIKNYIGKHGRRCELTDTEIEKIIASNCYYCDIEPSTFGEDDYCGLDRVDNTGHYTLGNVVPACTRCNNIKGCLSQDVLFKHIENIVCGTDNKIDFEYSTKTFLTYKHSANKRKKVFELSKSEFDTIIENECYICRNKSNNGIDRVVNSTGYITSNCQSACSSCNYMKKDLGLDVFLKHLETMYNTMKMCTFRELNHTQIQQKGILDKKACNKFKSETEQKKLAEMQKTITNASDKLETIRLGKSFDSMSL